LPGGIPDNFSYTKEYFEVTFDNVGKYEGIEGVLRVAKASTSSQLIAQKGFSISDCSWGGFYPVWASINLSGQAKLTLSPNRSLVIKDEKYYNLADKLQSKIFTEFERHLRFYKDSNTFRQYVKYVNELLQEELISLDERHTSRYVESKLNKFMEMIFLNYVPLLIISEKGERSYQIIRNLDKLPNVVIIPFSDWPEKIMEAKILEEVRRLINPNVVILLGGDRNDGKRLDFLYYIFGVPSDIYITSLPGIVIEKFTKNNKIPGIFTIGLNHFVLRMNSKIGTKDPLFVHYPENRCDPDNVIFNSQHRLLSRFIDGIHPINENSLKALEFLYDSFGNVLNDL
jgi:molecular chaperone HtpG